MFREILVHRPVLVDTNGNTYQPFSMRFNMTDTTTVSELETAISMQIQKSNYILCEIDRKTQITTLSGHQEIWIVDQPKSNCVIM